MKHKSEDEIQKQKLDKFKQHLNKASEIVSQWPDWKKDMLGFLSEERPVTPKILVGTHGGERQ